MSTTVMIKMKKKARQIGVEENGGEEEREEAEQKSSIREKDKV